MVVLSPHFLAVFFSHCFDWGWLVGPVSSKRLMQLVASRIWWLTNWCRAWTPPPWSPGNQITCTPPPWSHVKSLATAEVGSRIAVWSPLFLAGFSVRDLVTDELMPGMDTAAVKSRNPDYMYTAAVKSREVSGDGGGWISDCGFISSLLSRILQSGLRSRKDTWLLGPVRSLETQATCGRYGLEPEVRCHRFVPRRPFGEWDTDGDWCESMLCLDDWAFGDAAVGSGKAKFFFLYFNSAERNKQTTTHPICFCFFFFFFWQQPI